MKRVIKHLVLATIATGLLASAGCTVGYGYSASATVAGPEPQMAFVSPGVWVVADYGEPVFFSNNSYWLHRGGVWYRSGYYTGGWVRASVVPVGVRGIRRPRRYVRYRVRPGMRTRAVYRSGARRRAVRRNQRANRRNRRGVRRNRRQNVRDHRRATPARRATYRKPAPARKKARKKQRKKRKGAKVRDHR